MLTEFKLCELHKVRERVSVGRDRLSQLPRRCVLAPSPWSDLNQMFIIVLSVTEPHSFHITCCSGYTPEAARNAAATQLFAFPRRSQASSSHLILMCPFGLGLVTSSVTLLTLFCETKTGGQKV